MEPKLIDHLFRHHYGKMVSVLVRIFGLAHLETIEDAVQDTFVKALAAWRTNPPENPEAWLTAAAKNRVLDIFRKLKAEKRRIPDISSAGHSMAIADLFLDNEIADSQLRMIFAACHPDLSARDRLAFALKTISGFSSGEIASALLTRQETIKKRLTRARKAIKASKMSFKIPQGPALPERLESVHEVLYLIFNEGFHSGGTQMLVRKDLCGEAMRLCQLVLKQPGIRTPDTYALFALMCFHAARLDSKVNEQGQIIDLKNQDRSKWHFPLMNLGNEAMHMAIKQEHFTSYHYEAAIAAEHLKAKTFEDTDWDQILEWNEKLYKIQPSEITALNMAIVQLQCNEYEDARFRLQKIEPSKLEQRSYLYYATWSDFYRRTMQQNQAIASLELALTTVKNPVERDFLEKKKQELIIS